MIEARPLLYQLLRPIHANCQFLIMDYSGITYIYHFLHDRLFESVRLCVCVCGWRIIGEKEVRRTPILFLYTPFFSFHFSAVLLKLALRACAVIVYAHFPLDLKLKESFSSNHSSILPFFILLSLHTHTHRENLAWGWEIYTSRALL